MSIIHLKTIDTDNIHKAKLRLIIILINVYKYMHLVGYYNLENLKNKRPMSIIQNMIRYVTENYPRRII